MLTSLSFLIMYHTTPQQGKPNGLSRCSYLAPCWPPFYHKKQILLSMNCLQLVVANVFKALVDLSILSPFMQIFVWMFPITMPR